MKFLGERLACVQAAVNANQLHEIDDGGPPIQLFGFFCAMPFSTISMSTGGGCVVTGVAGGELATVPTPWEALAAGGDAF